MTALDFQPASRCRGTRSASCRHPLDLSPAEISQTKESKLEFTSVSNQFSSNSGHHIHRDQLKPAEITSFPTGCIVTNTEGEHLRLQRTAFCAVRQTKQRHLTRRKKKKVLQRWNKWHVNHQEPGCSPLASPPPWPRFLFKKASKSPIKTTIKTNHFRRASQYPIQFM